MSDGAKIQAVLKVRLYGPLLVGVSEQGALAGTRSLALVALLATAPSLSRTRAWLVSHLWSDHTHERGRANLRQLLHALRQQLGRAFDDIFVLTRQDIALRASAVLIMGTPTDGVLLEGFDLNDDGFDEWLLEQRQRQPVPMPAAVARQTVADNDASPDILPRIMVLPFSDIAQPVGLGDAVAQDFTGHFARSQLIDAISHFSCRSVPQHSSDFAEMADFALTGLCRSDGTRLILDCSLMDVPTGKVMWSDRQTTGLQDFLAGDDQTTLNLAGQILRVIMSQAIAATSTKPLPELEAHRLMVSAVSLMHAFDRRHFMQADAQLQEVVLRCPDHSVPRAWLAQWHLLRIYQKWSDDPKLDKSRARDAIRNALDLNPACPLSLALDGNIQTILLGDLTTAQSRFAAAQAINPSSAFISQIASVLETFRGQGAQAVALTDRALRLSPRDPRRPFFLTLSAGSYVAGGRYDEAVEMAEASLRHHPQHLSAHRCRVIGLQLAGREGDAVKAAAELLKLDPALSVSGYLRGHPAGQTETVHIWADALKEAGVPVN